MLPLHQRCLATRTWKKENRGIDNSSVWNGDGKSLLSLTFSHRTRSEPFSIPWKVIILPLHQRCSSTQTCTVENNLDLNASEARFSWKILIRLGLLRHAGLKTMSIAWRCVLLPLHQWYSSIPTLEKENIRVGYPFVTNITAKIPSMLYLLHRTGIETMSIAWKATMLPLHQRRRSTTIRKKENTRVVNSFVTNITAIFLSML